MNALGAVRQLKHRAFLAQKGARLWWRYRGKVWVDDWRWSVAESRKPFEYVSTQYAHTFLARRPPHAELREAPAILWAFWLGGEPSMTRRASLGALRGMPDFDVRIVSDPSQVELAGHAFHPAFKHLNVVHQSDYLRAYVMHHHGGLYCDVKPFTGALRPVVDQLNADPNAWVVGYREITSEYVPDLPHTLGDQIKRHYRAVMGPSGFVFRPGSAFTAEWMRELHARLDYYTGALEDAAAADADPYEAPDEYPIRWSEILGDIIQPLSMKYQTHILFTDAVRPVLKGYR